MKKLVLAFVVFPVIALGCSSSSSEDDDNDANDDNARASEFIAGYCDALMPCCAGAGLATDGAQCRGLFGAVYGSGDYGFDQAAADECTAWLESVSSAELCGDTVVTPPACERIFPPKGNQAPGQSCESTGDCALSPEGDVECIGVEPEQSICRLTIQGTAGSAPCGWTLRDGVYTGGWNIDEPRVYSCDSADGLRCDGTACVRLIPEGGACLETDECAASAFCSLETGSCQPLLPAGSACKFFDQCSHGECTNLVCVPDSPEDLGLAILCGGNAG
jgi:hypothetical protein